MNYRLVSNSSDKPTVVITLIVCSDYVLQRTYPSIGTMEGICTIENIGQIFESMA